MNRTVTVLCAVMLLAMQLPFTVPNAAAAATDDEREILYWVAPMDPNYRRDKPGKSPMGMDLIPVYADGNDAGGSTVTIAPEVVQNLGVRTARAERSRLWRGIDTVGYVDYDESKVSHIHLRTSGWIERLYVESEGERVKKGERLFDLYSPDLVNAQEEFVQALSLDNRALVQASGDRLKALGVPRDQINRLRKDRKAQQTISIYAPQDGVVSTLPVREGMFVKPATRVMSLADLSTIWLLAEVFERQADWVRTGHPAEVRLAFLPGRVWEGRVEYIYPSLDPLTRTLKVRLRFDNPGEALKPNMYANVKLFGGPRENAIVIPLEALIRTGREERVIIALGEGRFEARQVSAGIESGEWVEILEGVDAGEELVVSGQFLIDSEASLRASFTRMRGPSAEDRQTDRESMPVSGAGIVRGLMPEQRMISLDHAPIAALGWPAMTMDLSLADGVSLEGLAVEDPVRFQLEELDGRYVITSIDKQSRKEMQP